MAAAMTTTEGAQPHTNTPASKHSQSSSSVDQEEEEEEDSRSSDKTVVTSNTSPPSPTSIMDHPSFFHQTLGLTGRQTTAATNIFQYLKRLLDHPKTAIGRDAYDFVVRGLLLGLDLLPHQRTWHVGSIISQHDHYVVHVLGNNITLPPEGDFVAFVGMADASKLVEAVKAMAHSVENGLDSVQQAPAAVSLAPFLQARARTTNSNSYVSSDSATSGGSMSRSTDNTDTSTDSSGGGGSASAPVSNSTTSKKNSRHLDLVKEGKEEEEEKVPIDSEATESVSPPRTQAASAGNLPEAMAVVAEAQLDETETDETEAIEITTTKSKQEETTILAPVATASTADESSMIPTTSSSATLATTSGSSPAALQAPVQDKEEEEEEEEASSGASGNKPGTGVVRRASNNDSCCCVIL